MWSQISGRTKECVLIDRLFLSGRRLIRGGHHQEKELLVVGGSFGLREFSQIRYDAVKIKVDPELEKKLKMNKISLESEYEKIKDSTFEDWKNIRGPRPWEDPDLLQGRNPEILKTKTT
ncbi:cytochrome c oxidase assembly protein COX16 homolog, mitochondrial isoform X1 [Cavia porcellus]|uniref:cytochrome c oxidase assembly protein COX16 homolog, mitochondrial isoform X1 n=1 Tax=Cavia porcellus TaxID=10141 RepID=UPI000661E410|nr:cytochrome c oxidase assembly protein COX16 homolog, mitochondrial isoform X1 [Cavia porcellus]